MDKQLLHYKGSKKLILIVGMLTVTQAIAIIVQAIYLSDAIVKMYKGTAWNAVLSSFLCFLGALIARHFLQWLKEKWAYRFADQTSLDFQQRLIEKTFQLGPRIVGQEGSGNMITLCLEGIPNFRTYLRLFIPRAIAMACIPLALLVYIAIIDFSSAIILAVVLPVMIIFLILLGLAAQKQMDAQWATYQLLSRHFVDSLRGLVTLKFLGKSKGHQEAIGVVSNKYRIATNRTLRVAFLSTFSLDFFSSLSVAIVAVELGLRLINGNIDLAPALLILILAPEYFLPIRELGNDYHATMDGKEAGEKIHEVLAKESDEDSVYEENTALWNEKSKLVVKGLDQYSNEEDRFLLKDIQFEVSGFKKIGIVGTSGAGKSTLIDILSGFTKPTSGDIQVNEVSEPHFSTPHWQKQVTYIPQHPYIFSGTIAENIAWYAPDQPIEKIKQAAERAGLANLIESLPNGLNEKIGQGGRELSGGEEQRVALARGLLQNRPVTLFDEPTAHLDIETEHELKKTILSLMEGKLVFFATHRLHWMKNMDLIIVLDQGKIVEIGTHEELCKGNDSYSRLVEAHRGGIQNDEVI
ncbi:thiol reductant ABC exporter subunit CydD [Bacillus niameyensis]|uniref:thiol reductant ABC exporter subunit CydD n=1 Tax=Bacillus niameyensis TaxID=1522308 RepID=UPI000780CFB4|nr:thiol reductant ABC exporter subunit CydD [Bacillus niameyensis]